MSNTVLSTYATPDGRTREARLLRIYQSELTEKIGGSPSLPQQLAIARAARIQLRMASMDVVGDNDEYLSLARSLTDLLVYIGLDRVAS